MSEPRPWFPLYARDFLADDNVAAMTAEELGAYVRLLLHAWTNPGLPDDPKRLARLARISEDRWYEVWEAVEPCWTERDGRLYQGRLEAERERAEQRACTARENGARGGRPRKTQSVPEPDAETQSVPSGIAKANPGESSAQSQSQSQVPEGARGAPAPAAEPNPLPWQAVLDREEFQPLCVDSRLYPAIETWESHRRELGLKRWAAGTWVAQFRLALEHGVSAWVAAAEYSRTTGARSIYPDRVKRCADELNGSAGAPGRRTTSGKPAFDPLAYLERARATDQPRDVEAQPHP